MLSNSDKIAAQRRVGPGDAIERAGTHIAGRHHQTGLAHRRDGFVRRDLILMQFVRIERDHDGPLVPSKRRRSRHARQRREQRPHAVERKILKLSLRVRGAVKNQLTNGDAARIETSNERRHSSRRHESARAIHVAHSLRHHLVHVGAFVKHQLQ